jgi:hypothetical protein
MVRSREYGTEKAGCLATAATEIEIQRKFVAPQFREVRGEIRRGSF